MDYRLTPKLNTDRPYAMTRPGKLCGPIAWLASAMLVGCFSDHKSAETSPEPEVLDELGARVILPTLRDFANAAENLDAATTRWASDPSAANQLDAQDAWRTAMLLWEQAEIMQVGPAGQEFRCGPVGGEGRRDEIFSFPITSRCRIDIETTETAFRDPDALADELFNVRGLDAMEYLLFAEGTDNACPETSNINVDGTWAALTPDEILSRRAVYADSAAQLVAREAVALRNAWEPELGGFQTIWAGAGGIDSPYPDTKTALSDLFMALLYLDEFTKDLKLAVPVGLADCDTGCFDRLEFPDARIGLSSVKANLVAFDRLLRGDAPTADARGLSALLARTGGQAVTDKLHDRLMAIMTTIDELGEESIEVVYAADPTAIAALVDELRELVRILVTEAIPLIDPDWRACLRVIG